ncbi:uncharacterized protein LACBIDRAFT_328889 [Laccaria bicolor S238N-H82]|uniref:Predicted protein n=1 Tax=Laccaria bicolor (strain S238N-H82 / ATCC MYA-4686) TaxID=486041 RepID=B0DGB5_LACBS|nr:uncharacterized protein LACBIDRAFT_328889 [Laccaria bicolor S238N-H82]EDR06122.1 predicted protein [Laccaria bicolor S238N-H82]|eukprot:XP_001882983.1 predicted protein [Laccaria bicolor S238N-H82]
MPIVPQSFKRKSAFPTSEIIAHHQTEHANQSKTSSNAATPLVKGDPLVDPQSAATQKADLNNAQEEINNGLCIFVKGGPYLGVCATHYRWIYFYDFAPHRFNDLGDLGVDIPQLSVISDNGKTQSFGSKWSNTSHLGVQTAFGSSKGLIASGGYHYL